MEYCSVSIVYYNRLDSPANDPLTIVHIPVVKGFPLPPPLVYSDDAKTVANGLIYWQ